jgi:hypothetical protein
VAVAHLVVIDAVVSIGALKLVTVRARISDVRACEHKTEENQPTHFYCILLVDSLGFLALLVKNGSCR